MSETVKTYINVAVMAVVAVVLGCLLGDSITYFLGTNTDTVSATIFNDRMALVKEIYTEQNLQYQSLCMNLVDNDRDMRIVKNPKGELKIIDENGQVHEAEYLETVETQLLDENADALFDENGQPLSNAQLADQLFNQEPMVVTNSKDFAGDPITDVGLKMVNLQDGRVTWYMYNSEYGWISLLYSTKEEVESRMDVITVSVDEEYDDAWGILYSFEE